MRLYYVKKNTRLYSWLKKINTDTYSKLWEMANEVLAVVMDSFFLEKYIKSKSDFINSIDSAWTDPLQGGNDKEQVFRSFLKLMSEQNINNLISSNKMNEILAILDEEFFRIASLNNKLYDFDLKITSSEIATALEKKLFIDSRNDLDTILGILNV